MTKRVATVSPLNRREIEREYTLLDIDQNRDYTADCDFNVSSSVADIRQALNGFDSYVTRTNTPFDRYGLEEQREREKEGGCLLYTSPSPRDVHKSRIPSSA